MTCDLANFKGDEIEELKSPGGEQIPFSIQSYFDCHKLSWVRVYLRTKKNILMGANCDETHELMYEYTNHVVSEMELIEQKQYKVQRKDISFQCKLVPCDHKWMASMAGELNNAVTYF